jgi:hypothetical protein
VRNFLSAMRTWGDHGAQRVNVDFARGFGGCTATVQAALDATRSTQFTGFDGDQLKNASRRINGVSCMIQSRRDPRLGLAVRAVTKGRRRPLIK